MDSMVKEKYYDALAEYDKQNFEKAFAMLFELAEKGISKAQMEVGYMLYEGDGVKKNIENALYWFKKNIEDNSEAIRMVGWCYLKLNQNEKGKNYFEKAVELNNMDAYDNLGYFYDMGEYEYKINKQKALKYYTKSCSFGLKDSCINLTKLLEELNYDRVKYIQEKIGVLRFIHTLSRGKVLSILGYSIKCFFNSLRRFPS